MGHIPNNPEKMSLEGHGQLDIDEYITLTKPLFGGSG